MSTSNLKENEAKNWALFAHLSSFCGYLIPFGNILGPLVIWLIKKNESEFVNLHGKASVNFQISLLIYFCVSAILCLVLVGFLLIFALVIFDIVYTIINAIKASNGEKPNYPFSLNIV